jgi:nucleoside-diphosphate-sugar epimerase
LKEVVEIARREMHIDAQPEWGSMPGRTWDTNVWVANNERIRQELGWKPKHSFADGFHRTVQWFQDNPAILKMYSQDRF